jgi:hypothetical protein
MRRILRHLFTLCAALSLLLCVAVCVLWGTRSKYYRPLESSSRRIEHGWGWNDGKFIYYRTEDLSRGLLCLMADRTRTVHMSTVAAVLGGVPVSWVGWQLISSSLARRRTRLKCCLKCGYDLRAHVKGERCPECGMQVAAAS